MQIRGGRKGMCASAQKCLSTHTHTPTSVLQGTQARTRTHISILRKVGLVLSRLTFGANYARGSFLKWPFSLPAGTLLPTALLL